MIFALVPHSSRIKRSYAYAYMRSAAPLSRVSLVKWRRRVAIHLEQRRLRTIKIPRIPEDFARYVFCL